MISALDPKTALVLIDLQNGITQGALLTPLDALLANVTRLIDVFRNAGQPIVFVTVDPTRDTAAKHLRRESKMPLPDPMPEGWTDLVPQLHPAPEDIRICKQGWNAFYNTKLDELLKEKGVTGIVLGGVSTSIGVEGTARAAAERGYNIAFATDAMTDRDAKAQEHSQRTIFPRIGEVGDTAQVVGLLASEAS